MIISAVITISRLNSPAPIHKTPKTYSIKTYCIKIEFIVFTLFLNKKTPFEYLNNRT